MKLVFFVSAALALINSAHAAQARDPHILKITTPAAKSFLSLAGGHSECSCSFNRKGSCGCDATLEFMNCMAQVCENPKCDCQSTSHFLGACHQIGTECPNTGLQCFEDHANCVVPTATQNVGDGDDRESTFENEPVMNSEAASEGQSLPMLHAAEDRLEKLEEKLSQEETVEQEDKVAKEEKSSEDKDQAPLEDQESPEQLGSPMGSSSAMWGAAGNPKDWLALAAIQFAIISLAAEVYNRFRLGSPSPQSARTGQTPREGDFNNSLFSCLEDPKLSLFSFVCPCLRWADTLDKANKKPILQYYVAALLFALLLLLDPITAGISLLVLVLVATYFRQKLRSEFSLPAGGSTIWEDFLSYFCCFCCAVVQEARHVERGRAEAS